MLVILRIAYIILMVYLVSRMVKGGGCCGHSNHNRQHNDCHHSQNETFHSTIITEEEKRNAIDL